MTTSIDFQNLNNEYTLDNIQNFINTLQDEKNDSTKFLVYDSQNLNKEYTLDNIQDFINTLRNEKNVATRFLVYNSEQSTSEIIFLEFQNLNKQYTLENIQDFINTLQDEETRQKVAIEFLVYLTKNANNFLYSDLQDLQNYLTGIMGM